MRTAYRAIAPVTAPDGAEVRERMHPAVHGNRNLSLAEARLAAEPKTALHRHRAAEEIYHFVRGRGRMTLGAQTFAVAPGDTVCSAPGTPHCVANTGAEELVILCACAPPYCDADTELLDPGARLRAGVAARRAVARSGRPGGRSRGSRSVRLP